MKKFIGLVALALLLVPATAQAQPSCGDTITQDTTLTADLACDGTGYLGAALKISGAADITLDLGGHTLTGNGSFVGIAMGYSQNMTIRHGTVTGFTIGLFLSHSTATVERIKANRNGGGIDLASGDYLLEHVTADWNAFGGISVGRSATVTYDKTKQRHNG
jgi:hypothetical protein